MALQKWSPQMQGHQLLSLSKHLSIETLQGNYPVIMSQSMTATICLKKGCRWLFL